MTNSSASRPLLRQAIPVYVAMMLLYAASYFQRTAVPGTIFNELSADYGMSAVSIAGLGAAFVWVYSLSQLFVGMLADRFCGVRVVTFAGLLFALGVLLFPFACGNLKWMFVLRTLTGLGASAMYLSLVKETDRFFGRANYSMLIAICYFVGYSGGLFGTLPYEYLAEKFHWNTVLIYVGGLSALIYGIFLWSRRRMALPTPSGKRLSFLPLWTLMKNPYTWLPVFCSTVNFGTYYTIQTVFGKKFLQDFAGMSSRSAALVIFSLTLVCMFTLLGGGTFIRFNRNRRKPQMIAASAVTFLNTVMMLCAVKFCWPAWVFAVGYGLYALSSGFAIAFSMTCQELNSRSTVAQAAGFLNMVNYMSVAVFSLLIGKLLDSFVPPETFQRGTAVIYPAEAYGRIFLLLLIPAALSLLLVFRIPETRGHFVRQDKR